MSLPNTSDRRGAPRHQIVWKVAVVFERADGRKIFHGTTHEISQGGVSVFLDEDLSSVEGATLFLAIPPKRLYQPKVMIEVMSVVRHIERDEAKNCFDIDFEFRTFRGTGQTMLEKVLAEISGAARPMGGLPQGDGALY